MSVSVFDVADYILKQFHSRKECITTMKLQKLVYYCQAWSLVWDSEPLFNERIEAWANGPVIPTLFSEHQGQFLISEIARGDASNLSAQQIETVDAVLRAYGDKSAKWLIDLTHLEEPWLQAREGLSPLERGHSQITNDAMAEYYSSLS